MRYPWRLPSLVVLLVALAAPTPTTAGGEHAYVGSKKCKKCHIKEWRSWSKTKMANSFDALKPGERAEAKKSAGLDPDKDYTGDPECLPCHTVGFGKEGGFVDMETTPDRAGVGCEMCHGPGGTYLQDQYMSLKNKDYKREDLLAVGLADIEAETCTALCHNERSPFAEEGYVFDFEKRRSEGTHQVYPLKQQH